MKNLLKFAAAGILAGSSLWVHAFEEQQLYGTWCFYEQEESGNIAPAQVNVTFNTDGTYQWMDTQVQQKGTWRIRKNNLVLSETGAHKLVSVSGHRIVMTRDVTMKMRKDSCF